MIEYLKKIKSKTGLELAEFLGVSEPTIYSWEKKNTWPLWALEKCDVLPIFNHDVELKNKLWIYHDELLKANCETIASDLKLILIACT